MSILFARIQELSNSETAVEASQHESPANRVMCPRCDDELLLPIVVYELQRDASLKPAVVCAECTRPEDSEVLHAIEHNMNAREHINSLM